MTKEELIQSTDIQKALDDLGFDRCSGDGRLMLAELILKAGAGYRNSHTEEAFMNGFGLLKKDRTPNIKGRRFLCSMLYAPSHRRPEYFELMLNHRTANK